MSSSTPAQSLFSSKINARQLCQTVVLGLILVCEVIRTLQPPLTFISCEQKAPPTSHPSKRLALVNFIDQDDFLWGVYSIHTQMRKLNMTPSIRHIVMVDLEEMKSSSKALLDDWLGPENVKVVDRRSITDKVPRGVNLRPEVFPKILAFNLTEFDKLILLDNDVLIRMNLKHWFDYPAPAATHARGTLEFNSGAMVIEPSNRLFQALLDYIPKSREWRTFSDNGHDTWNSGRDDQGFLSAFFLSNATNDTVFTMRYGSSILSTDLGYIESNHYFWKYRPEALEAVHFTGHKPWMKYATKSRTNIPVVCIMLRQWLDSVSDAPKDKLPSLPNLTVNCPSADVSCGGHRAKSCDLCPQGHGAVFCHGDCMWCGLHDSCMSKVEHSTRCAA